MVEVCLMIVLVVEGLFEHKLCGCVGIQARGRPMMLNQGGSGSNDGSRRRGIGRDGRAGGRRRGGGRGGRVWLLRVAGLLLAGYNMLEQFCQLNKVNCSGVVCMEVTSGCICVCDYSTRECWRRRH